MDNDALDNLKIGDLNDYATSITGGWETHEQALYDLLKHLIHIV